MPSAGQMIGDWIVDKRWTLDSNTSDFNAPDNKDDEGAIGLTTKPWFCKHRRLKELTKITISWITFKCLI